MWIGTLLLNVDGMLFYVMWIGIFLFYNVAWHLLLYNMDWYVVFI